MSYAKADIDEEVTDAFASQCTIAKKVGEHLATLEGEDLMEALSPQMFSSLSKFLKDNEMRIRLSDSSDVAALSAHLDSIKDSLSDSINQKYA